MMRLGRLFKLGRFSFGAQYARLMREAWVKDPESVHQDWDLYFRDAKNTLVASPENNSTTNDKQQDLAISAHLLVRYYKHRGHELAELDPLNLKNFQEFGKQLAKNPLELDLKNHMILNEEDLDIPFNMPNNAYFTDIMAKFLGEKQEWTMREIATKLQRIYCGKASAEFLHMSNPEQQTWIMHEFEALEQLKVSKKEKIRLFQELTKAEVFNSFLNEKLKASKRFGVEGLDSMISGLNALIEEAVENNIEYIGFGMAHRGRLNALANVFQKPMQKIFAEFQENVGEQQNWGSSGDVKYHLGVTTEREISNKKIRLSILPNPSHLQAVNPVVMGHVKAVEDSLQTDKKTLAVLIHGDAALAGQGVVYECLQMSYLKHYDTFGVIHIVANNQIGFTTTPAEARTGLYCTDVGKSIQAPIIHVNADEPELVNAVMRLAIRFREKFHKDIFIDIIGYRRYGHNEQDQPAFTQPMMYQEIEKRKNICKIYEEKLIQEGVVTEAESKDMWAREYVKISQAYNDSLKETFDIKKWSIPIYHRVVDFTNLGEIKRTGISPEELQKLGKKLTEIPVGFNIHPQLRKIYDARKKAVETGQGIDFGTAESLAFASLVTEGFNIRLSGQDVERGTFSHRHAVLVDQINEQKYAPVRNFISAKEAPRIQIRNSFLSEFAALGFEYGYSVTNPNTLTIWQAQFGDFANGAQTMIDNFIASAQSKWGMQSGLVLNLPHGMDGQGPEHSSARVQRYLQMMSDSWIDLSKDKLSSLGYKPIKKNNMQVVYCSNAANLFHLYRRQLRRDYRKPLINIVSKKLLKLRDSASHLSDFNIDRFTTLYDESDKKINKKTVKKVVILAGQAYYSALEKRTDLNRQDVAIIRIEEIAPFHFAHFIAIIEQYSNCKDFVWFQEEHRNSGAWCYLAPRLEFCLDLLKKEGKIPAFNFGCVSRRNSASPAVGKKKKHDEEQKEILEELFRG